MTGRQSLKYLIGPAQDGMRLDLALVALSSGMSRRKIRSIIDVGGCYINRKRVRMASRSVRSGEKILLEFNEKTLGTMLKQKLKLSPTDILYCQNDIIAVNKPPGIPAQATRDQAIHHMGIYVRDYLRANAIARQEPQPIHRLDKDTSGIMLFALTSTAMQWMTGQFRNKQVEKLYLAVCFGTSRERNFEVRCHLSPIDKRTGSVRIVKAGGKPAHTFCEVLATSPDHKLSLIACRPITGRSHQIRVHLASRALPIVGDKRYGNTAGLLDELPAELQALAGRHHFLHAECLAFRPRPGAERVELEAAMPTDMQDFIARAHLSSVIR